MDRQVISQDGLTDKQLQQQKKEEEKGYSAKIAAAAIAKAKKERGSREEKTGRDDRLIKFGLPSGWNARPGCST